MRVKEVGRRVYDPVVYFPPGDVVGELLRPVAFSPDKVDIRVDVQIDEHLETTH